MKTTLTLSILMVAAAAYGAPGDKKAMTQYSKPPLEEIKKKLTPLQFKVTQQEGTETPFENAYWDNHRHGLYVDVVSGEPLFSSVDKFESGTGWRARPAHRQGEHRREGGQNFHDPDRGPFKHGDSIWASLDGPRRPACASMNSRVATSRRP